MCRMCLVEVERAAGCHPDAQLLHRGHPGHGGRHRLRQGEEGPGRRPGVPPDQPSARLPGLRQGRRVPAPGPDAGLRPRGDPVRGGEAPLREADPDLGAGAARPRALHPVQPVHPVRRGGGGGGPDRLHRPWRAAPGRHLPRAAVHLVLLGQHRTDLSGGRPDRQPVPVRRPTLGPRPGGVDVHDVRRRVPGGRPVLVQPVDPPARHRHRPGQPRLAVRQGPVRLGRRQPRGPAHRADGAQGRHPGRRVVARGARARWPRAAGRPCGGPGVGRGDRRCPAHQRGGLRLGPGGQGRARHRLGRRPAGRRAARPRWSWGCPGPPSTRRRRRPPWSC